VAALPGASAKTTNLESFPVVSENEWVVRASVLPSDESGIRDRRRTHPGRSMRFWYFYFMKDAPDRVRATAPEHASYWRELGLRAYLGDPSRTGREG
jgi:hypothetical protein